MYGATYVPISYLFIEHQTESVTPLAILPRRGKRMELGFDVVFLCAETKTLRQWELEEKRENIPLVG